MIRAFFVEFLLPLLLFLVVRSILKSMFGAARSVSRQSQSQPQAPTVQAGGELRKDPVCGTYVSTAVSITRIVNGQPFYFCSRQCADKYKG
jgi:YHS domain-containing protein